MSFYPVGAGFFRPARAFTKGCDHLLDFRTGHCLTGKNMHWFPVAGRTKRLFLPNDSSEMVVEPFLVSLSTGVAQLDNKPAIVGVYLSNKPGPVIDALVRVDHRIVCTGPAGG